MHGKLHCEWFYQILNTNKSYSCIFLYQEIKMAEAMIHTGIHTLLFSSAASLQIIAWTGPFWLMPVSCLSCIASLLLHASVNSALHLATGLCICCITFNLAHMETSCGSFDICPALGISFTIWWGGEDGWEGMVHFRWLCVTASLKCLSTKIGGCFLLVGQSCRLFPVFLHCKCVHKIPCCYHWQQLI